jgi:hypothetical protein
LTLQCSNSRLAAKQKGLWSRVVSFEEGDLDESETT